ncbi:hypothetical protein K493DRAFT_403847 [Basidiobolus meristosporus CBS 931.73]|uniref:Uncharacterized protein n=1 Tax=Basidiobolus meristosporus CBS 931.73 TaxID=1314790 RepID=A0A1Y1Z9R0_9FUNG|nr:hypothetical protein K493DRAFT_403847 [Basidiobolus meristosporus CBS 931.73]|eukprot:ORY06981.1 hypothetical protein K493DRAFT_403847 [Basidiobolus meristosporus CBS 931.73]
MNPKARGKKKQRQPLNTNDRRSALFPGNLGARMSAYVSDVGDASDEEFVYPKHRNHNRLANQKSGYLGDKLDRKSVESPLFSPNTPVPSQNASPLVSDADITPGKNSRRAKGYVPPIQQSGRNQSEAEETLPLFWKMNPSEARRRRSRSQQKKYPLFGTIPFLFLGVLCCFVYAFSTIPLSNVTLTAVKNVLAAEKELVFDAHLKGENWNVWAVEISTVDVGIFATPIKRGNTTEDRTTDIHQSYQEKRGTRPAEYLGNLDHLDEPITFRPGYGISGTSNNVTAQIRLRNPGKVTDEAENKWYQILRHPYELTFRGVLKYKLFFKSYTIRVCAIQGIDPSGDEIQYEPLIVCDRDSWDPRDPIYKN